MLLASVTLFGTAHALWVYQSSTTTRHVDTNFTVPSNGNYWHQAGAPASGQTFGEVVNNGFGPPRLKSSINITDGDCQRNNWNTTGDTSTGYTIHTDFTVNSGTGKVWVTEENNSQIPTCVFDSP